MVKHISNNWRSEPHLLLKAAKHCCRFKHAKPLENELRKQCRKIFNQRIDEVEKGKQPLDYKTPAEYYFGENNQPSAVV